MTRKFLLATLGESPAVITEAVDLLREQGIQPDGVILFHTEDPDCGRKRGTAAAAPAGPLWHL